MDDRKVYELARLKLAYHKQLWFMVGLILFSLIGLVLYILNVYDYHFQSLILAVMILLTGLIGIMVIDQKMRIISLKIKEL